MTLGIYCTVLFVVASLTDWLDGYWARKYQGTSDFGKFYDPAADKILILAAFLTLMYQGKIDPMLVFLILARDFFIGAVRSTAASRGQIISAKPLGKWKTAIQMIAVPILFIDSILFPQFFIQGATVLLWGSLGLSLVSAVEYFNLFRKGAS